MKFTDAQTKKVLIYLGRHASEILAVADIASTLSMPHSTIRYLLVDMEEKGLIERIPTKAFNKHSIRYMYKVVGQEE
jgi:DNA-binding IclR family transcriptional regulator